MSREFGELPNLSRISTEQLAEMALHQLTVCGLAQNIQITESMLSEHDEVEEVMQRPSHEAGVPAHCSGDQFRIVSLVESQHEMFGHALAISLPGDINGNFIRAQQYKVDRSKQEIVGFPKVIVAREPLASVNEDEYQDGINDILIDFDRDELTVMLRMLSRASKVFKGEEAYSIDRDVFMALANDNLDTLSGLFPENTLPPKEQISSAEHVLEWHDFLRAMDDLLRREGSHKSGVQQEIAVMHETGAGRYIINSLWDGGKLSGAEIFCYDRGMWKAQIIELGDAADYDDSQEQLVSPAWNRSDILETLQKGYKISRNIYSSYVGEALETLGQTDNLALSNVLYLHEDDTTT